MPTSVVATPSGPTASVQLAISGAPAPSVVYSTGWEPAGVDSWSAYGGSLMNLARSTAKARTGSASLAWSGAVGISRTITGLTIGLVYRAELWATGTEPGNFAMSVTGGPTGPAVALGSTWRRYSVDFTATATSHTIRLATADGHVVAADTYVDDAQVASLPAGYRPLTIMRTDVNGTGPVRLLDGQEPISGSMTAVDYEAALVGTLTYTVTDGLGVVTTASTTLAGLVTTPWVSVPVVPQLGATVQMVLDDYSATQDARGTTHVVIGRPDPVPTLAGLSSRSGPLSLVVADHPTAKALAGVYGAGHVVQLRQPSHAGMDMYHVGSRVTVRRQDTRWVVSLDYTEVATPAGPLQGGLGWDWGDVYETFTDWAAVRAAYPDWASLAAGAP